jgi:peptidoglycan/LPS O-acetylase OafA/YrhL
MKYVKGLDTLRAFAVIVVLVGHWGLPMELGTQGAAIFKGLFPSSRFGVDLFFVLSGYLITSILLDATEAAGESKMSIMGNFIARRTLRIFPIYYIAILVAVLLGDPFIRDHLGWFVTYTSNVLFYKQHGWDSFAHTWSLSVEEQFYLIWPWLIVFVSPRYLKYVFYLSIFIGIVMTFYVAKVQTPTNIYGLLLMPACIQAFGIGGLYAYYSRRDNEKKMFVKVINLIFPIALLFHFYWGFSADGGHFNYWYRTIDSLIAIWLIHHTITARQSWLKKNILENGILVKIGRVSYGIYLYHYAFPWVYSMVVSKIGVEGSGVRGFLSRNYSFSYFTQLILLFVVCAVSFEFIEKPILKLKRFFQYGKDKVRDRPGIENGLEGFVKLAK